LNGQREWRTLDPLLPTFAAGGSDKGLSLRGPGVADLANAISNGVPARCGADFALHVVEVLDLIANGTPNVTVLTTTCERPAPTQETWLS
jgi:hypothetical protein